MVGSVKSAQVQLERDFLERVGTFLTCAFLTFVELSSTTACIATSSSTPRQTRRVRYIISLVLAFCLDHSFPPLISCI
jgi:hypothetical protein